MIKQNNNGFSLIEVMISASLITIVSFGLVSLFLANSKYSRSVARLQQAAEVENYILSIIRDKNLCETKFVTSPTRTKAVEIPTLLQDPANDFQNAILAGGTPYPGLTIDTINVVDISTSKKGVNYGLATIELKFKNDNNGYVGGLPSKYFVLHFRHDGTTAKRLEECIVSRSYAENRAECVASGAEWINFERINPGPVYESLGEVCSPCELLNGNFGDSGGDAGAYECTL